MAFFRSLFATTLLIALPATVSADWQGIAWDTHVDAVEAGLDAVERVQGSEARTIYGNTELLRQSQSMAGHQFSVSLFFDDQDGLKMVDMNLVNLEDCDDLQRLIEHRYGRPAARGSLGERIWYDDEAGNEVSFHNLRLGRYARDTIQCIIRYEVLTDTSGF
jgi:hypothetical protein